MEIYLLYLKTAFVEEFNTDILYPKLVAAVKDITDTTEDIKIIPVGYAQLNYDVCLVLKSSIKLTKARSLAEKVNFAIKEDQGTYNKDYKVIVKADASYTVPTQNDKDNKSSADLDYKKRAENYTAVAPEYTFDRVILHDNVRERIDEALNIFKYQSKVFDEWGLREIEPHPSAALSFYGASGTGKTMAAEAIANKLGKKILRVSYADIESKYHGEGPKMVKAIFYAAERDGAVLFIDEADSLLSKRLTNVSSGSDQAINSMRSQLLISLERFEGIVIFATNLVVNYDNAFLTRLVSIEFLKPDAEARKKIWEVHTKPIGHSKLNIPLADDFCIDDLAEKYDFCGREIKKAVISACIRAAINQQPVVRQCDFLCACDKIVEEENALKNAKDYTSSENGRPVSPEMKELVQNVINKKISQGESENIINPNG